MVVMAVKFLREQPTITDILDANQESTNTSETPTSTTGNFPFNSLRLPLSERKHVSDAASPLKIFFFISSEIHNVLNAFFIFMTDADKV